MKVWIFNQDYKHHVRGDIDGIYENDRAAFHKSSGLVDVVDLPAALEGVDQKYIKVADDPELGWVVEKDTALESADQKAAQGLVLYNEMVKDIVTDMVSVFGTSDMNSASAYERTWNLMNATPSDWANAGLTARFARGQYDDGSGTMVSIKEGDALDTEAKVQAYADSCLDEVRQYGIRRMQRIEQFRRDKAAL